MSVEQAQRALGASQLVEHAGALEVTLNSSQQQWHDVGKVAAAVKVGDEIQ